VKAKLDGAHVTIGLGVLYVFGFIVANVHFGKYELPRIELFRARYIAAALLFILCSAIPFAAGAFLSRVLRTRAPGDGLRERGLKLKETEAWAMGAGPFFSWLLIAVGLDVLLVSRLTVSLVAALGLGALYFVMTMMVAWQLCDSLLGGESSDDAQAWPSVRMPQRVVYLCLWIILLPAGFSIFLYGSIKPELGGGALWKARLTWRATVDSSARASASGVVAIVDRDENTVNLIACSQSGPPARISVPTADVSSIQLGELVSPLSFLDNYVRHCRRIDSEPKSAAEVRRTLFAVILVLACVSALLLYRVLTDNRRVNVKPKTRGEEQR
jgi:hypothetical protein